MRVYFIQEGDSGPIKIGVAKCATRRLENLQVGNPRPLRIIGVAEVGRELEYELHSTLWPHLVRGEWYEPHPEVLAAVAEHSRPTDLSAARVLLDAYRKRAA